MLHSLHEQSMLSSPELSEGDAAKLQQFKEELQEDSDAGRDQREKAWEDMNFFYAPNGHWDGFEETVTNRRAKFQLDITSPFKNRFIAEWNSNSVGVEYKPDDDAASDKEAELLTGRRRIDFREEAGKIAQDNAVEEVAVCGCGDYMLATKFEDDSDPENENQRVVFRPIYNGFNTVYWDGASKWIDKRDARHVTRLETFTPSSFLDQYPGRNPVSAFQPDNWGYSSYSNQNQELIYIATRYEINRRKQTVWVYRNLEASGEDGGGTLEHYEKLAHDSIKDELKANPNIEFIRKRKIIIQTVEKTVFSGDAILEKTRKIAGKWLPIIRMYGYRGYLDGQEWYKGLIRTLKDPQRIFNTQISQMAEIACGTGTKKPIFAPEQMVGPVKEAWSNAVNLPYLLANPLKDEDGKIISPGPLGYLEPAQLNEAMTSLMQIVPNFIQSITGVPQDTLDPNASGKAINALIKRENQDTKPIMDNIGVSQEWEGIVYLSIAQEVYDTPRLLRTLGKDGVEGSEMILGVTVDEETGKPFQANKIAGKRFRVYADIGPQYDSMREQLVEELKGMLEALSNTPDGAKYTPVIIAMILQNITGPGLDPLKKMVRRDFLTMGLADPETDEEKQFMAQLQENQQKDPQAQLAESLAIQAESEGRERDSKAIMNTASAQKVLAQVKEILAGIEMDQAKTTSDILANQAKVEKELLDRIIKGVEGLPLGAR